ncbi:hypothetical protein HNQ94_001367 [Salirhabdus euzebyi]|uniref:Flagellar hook-length control protein-like C-terminal domain-containing protein n=1 Tax=Salirhabdus euzebyi TaxID=394506 RepID=A0A841Q3F0_9BACI|nr:flagellar hook-length control protein FliK [Salirhabdus euzebyi]MBB6452921.1 hypothetical protein [Salirhabdus euzebyi]
MQNVAMGIAPSTTIVTKHHVTNKGKVPGFYDFLSNQLNSETKNIEKVIGQNKKLEGTKQKLDELFQELNSLIELENANEDTLTEINSLISHILSFFDEVNHRNISLGEAWGVPDPRFTLNQFRVEGLQPFKNETLENYGTILLKAYELVGNEGSKTALELNQKLETALTKLMDLLIKDGSLAKNPVLQKDEKISKWQQLIQSVKNEMATTNGPILNKHTPLDKIRTIVVEALQHQFSETKDVATTKLNQVQLETLPMSKLEQYTIYINRQNSNSGTSQQLMNQMETVLKASQFLQKEGATELTIKIKPAHLGDMVVRFTQINGEMAVKIVVSSLATKELLEGNMSQLRHMFSPNQVVIEKQPDPVFTQQSQFTFNREQDEQEGFHQQTQEQHLEEAEEIGEEDETFRFKDLLMQSYEEV